MILNLELCLRVEDCAGNLQEAWTDPGDLSVIACARVVLEADAPESIARGLAERGMTVLRAQPPEAV